MKIRSRRYALSEQKAVTEVPRTKREYAFLIPCDACDRYDTSEPYRDKDTGGGGVTGYGDREYLPGKFEKQGSEIG